MTWLARRQKKKVDKLLAKGETARAIDLLEKAEAWDALVDVHRDQGDLKSAALAARNAGSIEQAAQLSEKAGAFREASELWLQASRPVRAATALEEARDFEAAAEIYRSAGMLSLAAESLAVLERYGSAAELYEQSGEPASSVKMYRAAEQLADAARVLEASGELEEAARLYYEAGNKASAAEMFKMADNTVESGRCYVELGQYGQAGQLLEEAGHLLSAAEAYEKEEGTLEKAADLFSKALRPQLAWRRELNSSPACLSVAKDGSAIAVGCDTRRVQLLQNAGELLWSFKPPWGGLPTCLAFSAEGLLAVGCDDRRLYCLGNDKSLLWSFGLPGEAVGLSMDQSGRHILCCTKGNVLLCLNYEGVLRWEYQAKSRVWDVSLTADGARAAVGMADGSCVILSGDGKQVGQYNAPEWVHSISLSPDGARCAVGTGMHGVALIDAGRFEPIWSAQDTSPVHNVVLTPGNTVLSVGDKEALLRDESGAVIFRYKAQERLLGGDIDAAQRFAVFRCVDRKLTRVDLLHCKDRAAAHYERAGNVNGAATMYEAVGEHAKAAEMFQSTGSDIDAARNLELDGRALEAAVLYDLAGELGKAAAIFQEQGEMEKAADCFSRMGEPEKAGELFEQAGNLAGAVAAFEQAEQYGKAGELYEEMGQVPAAINALTQHVTRHPDDLPRHLKLGMLMQKNGQYDTAIEQFQKTVADEQFRKASLMHMAESFVAKDLYDIAISRYRACIKEDEEVSLQNSDVYYGLGKAHELAGHYAEAKRIYQSILAIDYHYEDVKERLAEVETLGSLFTQRPEGVSMGGQSMAVGGGQYQMLSTETKERYAVKRLLGKGGMGEVYLAEDKRLKRTVALKIMPPELAADEMFRLRMVREAQAVAQISHTNVVAIFDVGDEAGRSYISMEYVEGQTLRDLLKEKGVLDPGECVALLRQIAAGLGYAHNKGITHRDMKPENVIVTTDGTAKIMDFGLAIVQGATRLTMPGNVSGTWSYMAPEQVRGGADLTAAADVYAVGCMAYELLTGRPPFTGDEVGIQHIAAAPEPLSAIRPDVPAPLSDIIMKSLEKLPEDRYPDASSLNAALAEIEGAAQQ